MASKEFQPLTEMSEDELESHLEELREELFNLRFRNKMRQLDNPLKIRQARRQIARTSTLLTDFDAARVHEIQGNAE